MKEYVMPFKKWKRKRKIKKMIKNGALHSSSDSNLGDDTNASSHANLQGCWGIAMGNFEPQYANEMPLKKDQKIQILYSTEKGWLVGSYKNPTGTSQQGLVPRDYIRITSGKLLTKAEYERTNDRSMPSNEDSGRASLARKVIEAPPPAFDSPHTVSSVPTTSTMQQPLLVSQESEFATDQLEIIMEDYMRVKLAEFQHEQQMLGKRAEEIEARFAAAELNKLNTMMVLREDINQFMIHAQYELSHDLSDSPGNSDSMLSTLDHRYDAIVARLALQESYLLEQGDVLSKLDTAFESEHATKQAFKMFITSLGNTPRRRIFFIKISAQLTASFESWEILEAGMIKREDTGGEKLVKGAQRFLDRMIPGLSAGAMLVSEPTSAFLSSRQVKKIHKINKKLAFVLANKRETAQHVAWKLTEAFGEQIDIINAEVAAKKVLKISKEFIIDHSLIDDEPLQDQLVTYIASRSMELFKVEPTPVVTNTQPSASFSPASHQFVRELGQDNSDMRAQLELQAAQSKQREAQEHRARLEAEERLRQLESRLAMLEERATPGL